MQTLKVFLSILAIAAAYTDIDNKKYDAVIADNEKLGSFLRCLVDKEACDDFGAPIKSHMVELLSDGCKECDEQQKHYAHIIITKMWKDFPELTEDYEKKYDPDRNLLKNLDTSISSY